MSQAPTKVEAVEQYESNSADLSTEQDEVRAWRRYILRAETLLELESRAAEAHKGKMYLKGQAEDAKGERIYLRYLPPLIEAMHRKTLPSIPDVSVTPKTESAAANSDKYAEFINQVMGMQCVDLRGKVKELQQDDDGWGVGFVRVKWKSYPTYPDAPAADVETLAVQTQRAMDENLDPAQMRVSDTDHDHAHIQVHNDAIGELVSAGMGPGNEHHDALVAHRDQHMQRIRVITKEHCVLERIRPSDFVYDVDMPWMSRSWDAQRKSVRIKTLMDQGYKNVNEENCPAEELEGANPTDIAWEDKNVRVWEIHDIDRNERLVISADGPEDGFFLDRDEWTYPEIDTVLPLTYRKHDPDQLHGLSTLGMAVPILDELAYVDFHIRRHVRTHSGYKIMGWDEGGKVKAGLNNPDQRFVDTPPGYKPFEYKPPPIPETLQLQRSSLLNELRKVIGADAQNTGGDTAHAITATESGVRARSHDESTEERQDITAEFLGRVAMVMVALYRKHATMQVGLRMVGDSGPQFASVNPADIPNDLELLFDVRGLTDAARQEGTIQATQLWNVMAANQQYPADWVKLTEYVMRKLGVKQPEQFRSAQAAAMMAMQPGQIPGMTGMPGKGAPGAGQVSPAVGKLPPGQSPTPEMQHPATTPYSPPAPSGSPGAQA